MHQAARVEKMLAFLREGVDFIDTLRRLDCQPPFGFARCRRTAWQDCFMLQLLGSDYLTGTAPASEMIWEASAEVT